MSPRRCIHYFVRRRTFVSEIKLNLSFIFRRVPSRSRFTERRNVKGSYRDTSLKEGFNELARFSLMLQSVSWKTRDFSGEKSLRVTCQNIFRRPTFPSCENEVLPKEDLYKTAAHINVFDVITWRPPYNFHAAKHVQKKKKKKGMTSYLSRPNTCNLRSTVPDNAKRQDIISYDVSGLKHSGRYANRTILASYSEGKIFVILS